MAAAVEVILREDVNKLGKIGDVVRVKRGYARNFLVPRGLAVVATAGSIKQVEHEKKAALARAAKLRQEAQDHKAELEKLVLEVRKPAGEEGKLYGAVTSKDIAEALKAQGKDIDRRKIILSAPLKELGEHSVEVKLAPDVVAVCKLNIAAQA